VFEPSPLEVMGQLRVNVKISFRMMAGFGLSLSIRSLERFLVGRVQGFIAVRPSGLGFLGSVNLGLLEKGVGCSFVALASRVGVTLIHIVFAR